MLKRMLQIACLVLVTGFAFLNFDYWQDPAYWRRWWDLITHPQADRMNFSPTVGIQSDRSNFLPQVMPGEETISAAALNDAQAFAQAQDSFALLVIHRGKLQREWYGPGWKPDRLTQSQSMMKTLTAIMLGLAIEDGFIKSVDDPVARYLPEWAEDPRGQISLKNLLVMSSGLAQYRFTLNPFARDSSFRFLNSSDRNPVVLATALTWDPGSRFDYNDVNAQLAGMIVERATGQAYADYFQERLWGPMGGQYAELWLDRKDGMAMTACCLLASPRDWAKVGVMMKDDGQFNEQRIVPEQWLDQMLQPSEQYSGYGYFTWLGKGLNEKAPPKESRGYQKDEDFLADDLFLLLGYGGQRVYVSRQLDLVVVRLGP
ncbi:MAG: serine hydrolase domain-containing protein, partial [Gammaproteobacteria bacterium]